MIGSQRDKNPTGNSERRLFARLVVSDGLAACPDSFRLPLLWEPVEQACTVAAASQSPTNDPPSQRL